MKKITKIILSCLVFLFILFVCVKIYIEGSPSSPPPSVKPKLAAGMVLEKDYIHWDPRLRGEFIAFAYWAKFIIPQESYTDFMSINGFAGQTDKWEPVPDYLLASEMPWWKPLGSGVLEKWVMRTEVARKGQSLGIINCQYHNGELFYFRSGYTKETNSIPPIRPWKP
jgi:hypothetical protein